jgi:long-chain fatty acid transport protein
MTPRPKPRSSTGLRRATVAALVALAPSAAHAGGFALFEPAASGLGRAGASLTQAADAGSLAYNPALIAFLRGRQLSLGAAAFSDTASFAADGASRELGERQLIVPPGVFYTHRLSDRLVLGAGVTQPFGFKTGWAEPESFSGRFLAQRASLESHVITPAVAYRLADRLAFGAGLDVRFSRLALERRVGARLNNVVMDAAELRITTARTVDLGFHVGLLAKPAADLSCALVYRHGGHVSASGNGRFELLPTGQADADAAIARVLPSGDVPTTVAMALPSHVGMGAAYERGDWTLEADAAWYRWSAVHGVPITFEGRDDLSGTIPLGYADAWQARLGVERLVFRNWKARAGYFFEQSPAPAATLSPFLPDGDRHGVALGAAWSNPKLRFDAGAFYAFSPARANADGAAGYAGTYQTTQVGAAVSVGFVF